MYGRVVWSTHEGLGCVAIRTAFWCPLCRCKKDSVIGLKCSLVDALTGCYCRTHQVRFIFIALYTIETVSKQLHTALKCESSRINYAHFKNNQFCYKHMLIMCWKRNGNSSCHEKCRALCTCRACTSDFLRFLTYMKIDCLQKHICCCCGFHERGRWERTIHIR